LFRKGEPDKYIRDYYFVNKQLGFVITDNRILNRTSNGGISWEEVPVGAQVLDELFFINDSTGWLVGRNKIYKTTDGGLSWPVIHENLSDDFYRYIYFSDENNGWAASVDNDVIRTTDGGITWLFEEPVQLLSDVQLAEYSNKVWAFGHSGLILKYNYEGSNSAIITSFTASFNNSEVILNWSTASENANKGFEIERISVSNQQNSQWEKIGFVEGKGTTNEPQSYSFTDTNIEDGELNYRLKNISAGGNSSYSNIIAVSGITSVADKTIPDKYSLSQNYPNPFNPSTTINYALPLESFTTLKIYDITGREVAILVNERKQAGRYTVNFNAENYASGVYYYTIRAGDYFRSRKMILLK
jgi:hypothetical protein